MSLKDLRSLSVEFTIRSGAVRGIRLDWTARQWVNLLNREGPWLRSNIVEEVIRLLLTTILYEDCWCYGEKLIRVQELLVLNGDELFSDVDNATYARIRGDRFDKEAEPDEQDPFIRLADIWRAVRGNLDIDPDFLAAIRNAAKT